LGRCLRAGVEDGVQGLALIALFLQSLATTDYNVNVGVNRDEAENVNVGRQQTASMSCGVGAAEEKMPKQGQRWRERAKERIVDG